MTFFQSCVPDVKSRHFMDSDMTVSQSYMAGAKLSHTMGSDITLNHLSVAAEPFIETKVCRLFSKGNSFLAIVISYPFERQSTH